MHLIPHALMQHAVEPSFPPLTADVLALFEYFKRFDRDKDGKISGTEVVNRSQSVTLPPSVDHRAFIRVRRGEEEYLGRCISLEVEGLDLCGQAC